MTAEAFAENQATTTVTSGGTDAPAGGTQETWTVASSAMFPAVSSSATPPTQFHIADEAAGFTSEIIAVTNVSGTTWTVTRGAESTTPVAHSAGFTAVQVITTGWLGSVQANGADWTNVVAEGADPTGAANSDTAFADAVTIYSSTGRPVYIPTGTYKIASTLNWKVPGLVVITDGAANTKITMATANTPILQVAGQSQSIGGLTLAYASQQPSSDTAAIGVEFGDNSVGSCFMSVFEELRVELSAVGMAINPAVSTVAGLFSCYFGNIEIFGYSIQAMFFNGSNGGGANCTGCHFSNVYIHNNFTGSDANSTSWPLELDGWDEAVFDQLNIEHAEVFDSDACLFTHCGNIIINSMHCEHLELSGNPGFGLIAVGTGTGMVQVNGLSVRFMTFSGTSYNSVFRVTAGTGQNIILNGLNFPSADGGDSTSAIPIVDFNSTTDVSAQLTGLNGTAAQLWTETCANAGAGCSGQITDGSQITYFPALAWTTFTTGNMGNNLNMSSGFAKTTVAGTWYYAAAYVPYTVTLTGVILNTGGSGTHDKWMAALWPAAGGTALANSATAGATTPAANTNAKWAFTSPVTVPGPGAYFIGLQSNGTTDSFLSYGNTNEGFATGSAAGTFSTVISLTAPSTYSADVGPFAKTY